jgi:hypothetical protein
MIQKENKHFPRPTSISKEKDLLRELTKSEKC